MHIADYIPLTPTPTTLSPKLKLKLAYPKPYLADANVVENAAIDLESFSRHAGRTTITTDDVLLMTRKNEALQGILRDFVEKEQSKVPKGKGAGKGKGKARGN